MAERVCNVFTQPLQTGGCAVKENHPYSKAGLCFSVSKETYRMDYWMYSYQDMFTVSVSDMYFKEDLTNTFPLTEFANIYYYDSGEGYELPSMIPIPKGRVAAFVAEGNSYTATYRGNVPVHGVSITITPAYYEKHLSDKLPGGFSRLKKIFCTFNHREDSPELLMVMRQIQNCRITGTSAHLYYESKVNEAIALVIAQVESKEKVIRCTPCDRQQLQQVEQFLAKHYGGDISLTDLARLSCMSVSKLKYTFKAVYGCNISDYISALRLDHAKKLLQFGKSSIAGVAEEVGYKTTAAFSKMFKEKTGMLPKDYRKSAAGAK